MQFRSGEWAPQPMSGGRGSGDPTAMSPKRDPIEPAAQRSTAPATIILTREGEEELRAKLAALREVIDVELPRRLRSAREFGEATDNDDYLQIREEEAVASARMRALAEVLATARIVDDDRAVADVVTVGSTVTIRAGGRTVARRLVGAYEVDGDAVSASSPIGQAILGHSPGDRVVVELPSGAEQEIEIVAVAEPGADPIAVPDGAQASTSPRLIA